jgi:hypothetical protein
MLQVTLTAPLGEPTVPGAHCPKHHEWNLVLLHELNQVPLGSGSGGAPEHTSTAAQRRVSLSVVS